MKKTEPSVLLEPRWVKALKIAFVLLLGGALSFAGGAVVVLSMIGMGLSAGSSASDGVWLIALVILVVVSFGIWGIRWILKKEPIQPTQQQRP